MDGPEDRIVDFGVVGSRVEIIGLIWGKGCCKIAWWEPRKVGFEELNAGMKHLNGVGSSCESSDDYQISTMQD